MLVSDFHFDLPEELIAQHPPAERGSEPDAECWRGRPVTMQDSMFRDLPTHLRAGGFAGAERFAGAAGTAVCDARGAGDAGRVSGAEWGGGGVADGGG